MTFVSGYLVALGSEWVANSKMDKEHVWEHNFDGPIEALSAGFGYHVRDQRKLFVAKSQFPRKRRLNVLVLILG